MKLVINELSYGKTTSDVKAKQWYDTFFDECIAIEKEYKSKVTLIYSLPISNHAFNSDYSFGSWINGLLDSDYKSSILGMLTQDPIIHDYPYYKVYGVEGKGIGYAFDTNELLISIQSDANWKVSTLKVTKESLNEETLDFESEHKNINNIHDKKSRLSHNAFILQKIKELSEDKLKELTNGSILWKKCNIFFPNIVFCDSVETQIKFLSGSSIVALRKRLQELQMYLSNWNSGDFDYKAIGGDARLESDTRISKYPALKIMCPDGKYRLFSYHCDWWLWGYRMHFYPDSNNHKCIIGYIGKKII
jgi:hypothetical protein